MTLEHVAIWTNDLERLKTFYCTWFGGVSNEKYFNPNKNFESYFIHFASGARLEIMQKPGIPGNLNDTIGEQHIGIIHLAFAVPCSRWKTKQKNYQPLDIPFLAAQEKPVMGIMNLKRWTRIITG